MMLRLVICVAISATPIEPLTALAAEPLALETTIPLPNTSGRIDHLSVDVVRKRLFIAEIGNGSVDIVDLNARKVIQRIAGLDEPQGVVYAPKADLIAVACGGDGTVRIFTASDFSPRGVVRLGDDADNMRLDSRNGHVIVGYGDGALAIIDTANAEKLADVRLPAHPEGFALSPPGGRAYVNVPDAGQIDVVDLDGGKLEAKWSLPHLSSNFPIALDDGGHVAVATRVPAKMVLFDASGHVAAASDACGDADDVFFDVKRKRFYLSCGAGAIEVFERPGSNLHTLARISSSWGARTSLFVPELDRLYVAARAGLLGSNAALQVYRPVP